jgi:hypothetical protein
MKRHTLVIIGLALIGIALAGYGMAWVLHVPGWVGIAVTLGAMLFIGIGVLCLIVGIAVMILKTPDRGPDDRLGP